MKRPTPTDNLPAMFGFKGRVSRMWYWLSQIGLLVICQLGNMVMLLISKSMKDAHEATGINVAIVLACLFATLLVLAVFAGASVSACSFSVRRWHDRGRSWWWVIIGAIPIVGWTWQFVECGCMEGTLGENGYGASPKGITGVTFAAPAAT